MTSARTTPGICLVGAALAIVSSSLSAASCAPLATQPNMRDAPKAVQKELEACRGGNPKSCGLLGQRFFAGDEVEQDDRRAGYYNSLACQHNDVLGCTNWGLMNAFGESMERDPQEAQRALEIGCSGKERRACWALAMELWESPTQSSGRARAASLAGQACEQGWGLSCTLRGRFELVGVEGPANPKESIRWFSKGCELRAGRSCELWAQLLRYSKDVENDYPQALRLFQIACEHDLPESCFEAGKMLLEGKGAVASCQEATKPLELACKAEIANACAALGHCEHQVNPSKGQARLRTTCTNGSADACYYLGKLQAPKEGTKLEAEWVTGLFQKSCESEASTYRDEACTLWGARLLNGTGALRDVGKGTEMLSSLCPRHADACAELAAFYEMDDAVGSPDKALKFHEAACLGHLHSSCERAAALRVANGSTQTQASGSEREGKGQFPAE